MMEQYYLGIHTQLKVDEVYYGDISKDNIIDITEEYFVTDSEIGKTIHTQENYVPAKIGKQYIFFLKKYGDSTKYKGMYYPIDLQNGKYLISDKLIKTNSNHSINALSNEELEVGSKDSTKYMEWMIKVIDKYEKKEQYE